MSEDVSYTYASPEEAKKRAEELRAKIAENNALVETLDVEQYALKILINSSYGAVSSPMNPIGDNDLANAITMMGSKSIRQVNEIAKDFVRSENPNASPTEIERCVVFNDTDSCGICLESCGVNMFDGTTVTPEGYALVQRCDDFINSEFPKWYASITNSHNCRLYFKREKICRRGLWLKKKDSEEESKKHYCLWIFDNEGVKHPKFKFTGVKFARSSVPAKLKKLSQKVAENMIATVDKQSTDKLLEELHDKFNHLHLNDRAIIQAVNNIEKYLDFSNPNGFPWKSSTPGHVRAAIIYNILVQHFNLKQHRLIKSGDIVKIVFVKPNEYGIARIAYPEEFPEEFYNIFQIDNETMFQKVIGDELKSFYQSVDWPYPNPEEKYENNIFDILGV